MKISLDFLHSLEQVNSYARLLNVPSLSVFMQFSSLELLLEQRKFGLEIMSEIDVL